MEALFEPLGGGRYRPSELTRGPWDPNAQHGGAPAALLGGLIERHEPGVGLRVVRVGFELLRPVPLTELEAEVELVRPGRRVQLVEARLRAGGEPVVRATALRIRRDPDAAPAVEDDGGPAPGPDEAAEQPFVHQDPGRASFAGDGMEIRFARGSFDPGPALAWLRLRVPVLPGEQPSPLQRALAAADFGNGVAAPLDWERHLFINPDLVVFLEREPEGEWIGLDARTRVGADGTGVAESVLRDERGRIGRGVQALLVGARSGPG